MGKGETETALAKADPRVRVWRPADQSSECKEMQARNVSHWRFNLVSSSQSKVGVIWWITAVLQNRCPICASAEYQKVETNSIQI